ncbi:MAG TPA: FmdB family zinc ribbon protein [Vicinamibacterales bacterium]|jgi:putative FmdB family regulatory protein
MPLYEYECEKCGHRFEKIQKFSDPPIETCPKCGSRVRKLMSSPAIQFKGSGWYITDYAKKDSSPSGKTERAETKSESKSDSTSDSKTDSTSSKTDSKTTKTETSTTPKT